MATPVHLRALQALELAVRTGSLAATAEKLSITPAAVGQRIKAIEDYLGLDLVVRGRSGIRPTRELEAAMAHLSAAFKELEIVTDILDYQRVHEIHIVADADLAELWLRPRLPAFKADYQNTLFCINGLGDIPDRLTDADCEIWFGELRQPEFEDVLFRDYLLPVSSAEIMGRVFGRPKNELLEGLPLLHLDSYKVDPAAIGWPDWTRKFGYRKTAPDRGIRYAHATHAIEAVHSDAGLLICGMMLILDQLQSRKLCTPFPLSQGSWTGHSYNIAFRKDAMRRRQIIQFREWVLAEGRKAEELLNGLAGRGPTDETN